MTSRAEILNSFIGELQDFERKIDALAVANEARAVATRWRIQDVAALMQRHSENEQLAPTLVNQS